MFPWGPGTDGSFAALSVYMYQHGCRKLAMLSGPNAASEATTNSGISAFKSLGGTVVYTATLPSTAADVSPQVAGAVKSGAQCAIPVVPAAVTIPFVTGLRASDPNMLIASEGLTNAAIDKLSSTFKGTINAYPNYPDESPQTQAFTSALAAYKSGAVADQWSMYAYDAVETVAQVGKGVSDLTAPNLLAALNKATVTPVGFPVPINFGSPKEVPGYARVFNTAIVISMFDGAKYVAVPGTVDVQPYLHG
jgi:hypothetical protein